MPQRHHFKRPAPPPRRSRPPPEDLKEGAESFLRYQLERAQRRYRRAPTWDDAHGIGFFAGRVFRLREELAEGLE